MTTEKKFLRHTDDAGVWAEEFCRQNPDSGIDQETMIGWLTNYAVTRENHWRPKVQNAVITASGIKIFEGCLSVWLVLNLENGYSQKFGHDNLYMSASYRHHDKMSFGGHFVYRCMELAGVGSWDDLKGKVIKVKGDESCITEIGDALGNDWFCPDEDLFRAVTGKESINE